MNSVRVSSPKGVVIGEPQDWPQLNDVWFYQVLYGIIGLLGFWFIIEGLKYVEASIGGLLGLLEIVFSIGFGILIFHEALTLKVAVGALLIISAAALPHVADMRKRLLTQSG